jgi:signal transduction histidine kinase
MARSRLHGIVRFLGPLLPPLLLCGFLFFLLREPLDWWLHGEEIYDEQTIKEWVREARVGFRTLPELLKDFAKISERCSAQLREAEQNPIALETTLYQHERKRAEIREMLKVLGAPPTKIYTGQLPLFPIIYRLEVIFDDDFKGRYDPRLNLGPIVWDAELPRHPNQYRELPAYPLLPEEGAAVRVEYHLHAYMQKQFKEREDATRRVWVTGGGIILIGAALIWIYLAQRRARQRDRQRLLTEQKINAAERRQLHEELRRQEAEREALELKSQMFHNIGIMAKSYAHNIKNLLVRPNDLLRRCLEDHPARPEQEHMLAEVKQTLGTVTERLQEILQTVQRDPSKFERVRLDLNALARDLHRTWAEQALDKWKMVLELDLDRGGEPLFIEGDRSHLLQALENFLFNARDAVAEMRSHLRQQARPAGPPDEAQRQAMIAAAGWKGRVILRTRREDHQAIIEMQDNGIGMSEEVRRHCTEPHYSTKRDNALYAGLSAGMGLGLSFVQMTLAHQNATLEVESAPLQGALFRVRFPHAEVAETKELSG